MRKSGYIFSFVLSCIFSTVFSQQLRFKNITSEDGLSTNYVKAIMQDELGFMWFGTQDGLNKYDGYQLRIFRNDPTVAGSLSSSDVTALEQANPHLILVGTREGLNFFNPITEQASVLDKVDGRLNSKVNVIFKIDNKNALVGTDRGLFMLDFEARLIKNPYFTEAEEVSVKCIAKINDVVYVGTEGKGLWRLNSRNKLERVDFVLPDYMTINPAHLETITYIDQYGGKMYLGTNGFGIFKVDRQFEIEGQISLAKVNESSNFIRGFVIRNNKAHIASAHGLVVYNLLNDEINIYTKQETPLSINSNPITCIFSDKDNNFWIGTELGGVNISFFRSQKFPTSNFNYETNFNNIYAFCEIRKGLVMLGGVNTLEELDTETGLSISHNKILDNATVLAIVRESDGIYWIGTWGNGLLRYDAKAKKAKTVLDPKMGGTIVSLLRDGNDLYAGSVGDGLFKIDLATLTVVRYTDKEGLPDRSIHSIFKDSKGRFWLGTSENGLARIDAFTTGNLKVGATYNNKGKQGQIASNLVLGINEDSRGTIWAATSTGLSKLLPDNSFSNFYSKHGLASTYLYSVLKDSTNNFWMSSNFGIIRFNPLATDKEISFKNYNIKDGLINIEYNMGAAHLGASGAMYFGGAKGFNTFRPSQIKDNLHVPEAYVIGYKRGGNDVSTDSLIVYKKHLELSWTENYFQFEVAAMDYTDPAKNKFRYKLEGYDKDWSAPTTVRYVSYTELPGGSYIFKVKAANNDGIWNEKPYELHITVVPPFWKTKTFYILVAIFGLLLIYAYTQYRTKAIKKENKILENKVAERTRELEEKNRDITSSIEYAKRIQEAILPSRETIFKKLKKVFILYQPKDIVSGDFYWFAEEAGVKIFAVVDCTGHGVPGAFMSMIGHNLLHQIVLEKGITDPGDILNHLHKGVQEALRQGHNEINTNDGMDVSIITINDTTKEIKWAGANRPLVIIDNNRNMTRLDGNKFPIGGAQLDHNRVFSTRKVDIASASMAYMFSDGYADQFGGDKGKKFMVKRFHDLLGEIHLLSAEEQKERLKKSFEDWRQNHEQVDDVLIVGIEI